MNKKFSTLVAAILAAGAWTTVSADVVKVSPSVGGTYLIGTEVNEASDKMTNMLKGTNLAIVSESAAIANMDEAFILEHHSQLS